MVPNTPRQWLIIRMVVIKDPFMVFVLPWKW
jgi:hypothetical protein